MRFSVRPWLVSLALAAPLPVLAGSLEACMGMVTGAKLGASFRSMMVQTGMSTQTYAMLVKKLGNEKAEAMFRDEMGPVVARYQDEWNQNLARAWGQLLSDAECQSIGKLGPRSPYRTRFETYTPAAAEAMRTTSAPLLTRAVSEVLYSAFAKSMAPAAPPR